MSFELEKEIFNLEEEITKEENELNAINILYNKIPKKDNNINQKEENIKEKIESLINTSNIISKIDEINEAPNPKDKLYLLNELFHKELISNPVLKKYFINNLLNNDILKLIEESFLNIKYPIFQGKILMTIFDELTTSNKPDLEIINIYLELFSYLIKDLYKEFPNYGSVSELIVKNSEENYNNQKFNFVEILPDILFKKIITNIFNEVKYNKEHEKNYISRLNEEEKDILFKFEKLILYINKAIANTSELISLISNENKNINKNFMIKYLINNLFEKLILFSISEKSSLEINNSSVFLFILLIHKISEQMNELNTNYQYDSLKNISFYDFIRYYTTGTQKELDIINAQEKFIDNIINKLKENITQEKNTEEILEVISLMIKDIISLFETFRTLKIIEDLLISSCNKILNIFKEIYKNKIDTLFSQKENDLINNLLFITNLLYNFSFVCSKEFDIFIQRLNLFDENFKNTITNKLKAFNLEIKELFTDYKIALLSKIKFEKLIYLFNYKNLKEGNDSDNIKNTINEMNEFWSKIKDVLDNIHADKKLIKEIINEVTKNFIKELSLIVLNSIEKSDIEGNNLDVLIDKTKFFIENNFMNEDIDDKEIKKDIIKLYSYLDNLYLNKK